MEIYRKAVSTLYVIRHGQASFGQPDYDVLSPTGVEQARRLGEWFASFGPRLDALYVGPRRRQRDTAAHMLGVLGVPFEPKLVQDLDEYPAEVIIRQSLPALMAEDPEIADLFGGDPLAQPADARRFQQIFEHVMTRWARGEMVVDGYVPFAEFGTRVRAALMHIMRHEGRGRVVAAVTSAGPISIAVQMGLLIDDAMAMKTSWVVANSSLTELRWREELITLVAFNALPHLGESRLVTYR
jgi:broad specificity phosphatase PhoE